VTRDGNTVTRDATRTGPNGGVISSHDTRTRDGSTVTREGSTTGPKGKTVKRQSTTQRGSRRAHR
jgi:hypothetical protein